VAGCGGHSLSGSAGTTGTTGTTGTGALPNTLTITVDGGPSALMNAGGYAANTLYATLTICTPGNASACQTIDHVQIDTGSVGVQILAEALNGSAAPAPIKDPSTQLPLFECVTFADGYVWGSMVTADVSIAGRTLSSLPIHLIGDAAAGSAPAACVSGPNENSVAVFGANGILGVQNWLQDCGSGCVTNIPAQDTPYYVCSNAATANQSCTATTIALTSQMQNPVGALSADNNGVKFVLPAVSAPGAPSVNGMMYFGVGTQSDNSLGSATVYTVNGYAYLNTTYNNTLLSQSFVDSGSNAYFFDDSNIAVCPSTDQVAAGWYCPPSTLNLSATLAGQNGAQATIGFSVDNADSLFGGTTILTAYPTLAAPNTVANSVSNSFDWGLPFFYGRTVYVLFENDAQGPAVAF
jgi:hypothetical protein